MTFTTHAGLCEGFDEIPQTTTNRSRISGTGRSVCKRRGDGIDGGGAADDDEHDEVTTCYPKKQNHYSSSSGLLSTTGNDDASPENSVLRSGRQQNGNTAPRREGNREHRVIGTELAGPSQSGVLLCFRHNSLPKCHPNINNRISFPFSSTVAAGRGRKEGNLGIRQTGGARKRNISPCRGRCVWSHPPGPFRPYN